MIWLAHCSDFSPQFFEAALPLLPQEKQASIERIRHERARRESMLAWSMLMLARMRQSLPLHAALRFHEHGKPYYPDEPFHFNLSHSDGFVCLAVSAYPVGVDIQVTTAPSDALKKRVLSENERAALSRAEDPNTAFTALWACKESCLKYRGTGIADALDALDVSAALDSASFRLDGAFLQVWKTPDYALAVCGEESAWSLQVIRPEDFGDFSVFFDEPGCIKYNESK